MAESDEAPAATGASMENSGEGSAKYSTRSSGESLVAPDDASTEKTFDLVIQRFLLTAKQSGAMPDFGPDVITAAAHLAKLGDGYIEKIAARLRKVGCYPNEVAGWVAAVERRLHGRSIILIPATEIMTRPDPKFIIEGFVEEQSFAVVYAASGVGKTFIILDWCFCVSAGIPWLGHKVMAGPVVYVGAEGLGGIPKRLRALAEHYDMNEPSSGFYIVGEAVNLLDSSAVAEALEEVRRVGVAPRMVVLDTYARSIVGGDENSAKDAGVAVEAIDRLRFDLQTAVVVVHHLGKAGTTERGSGALRGAADTMILLEKEKKSGLLTLTIDKQKNFEAGTPTTLRLELVGDSVVPVDATTEGIEAMWECAASVAVAPHASEKMRDEIVSALRAADAEGDTPITQSKLLKDIFGNAEAKAKVLKELFADEDSGVVMEKQGRSNLVSLRH